MVSTLLRNSLDQKASTSNVRHHLDKPQRGNAVQPIARSMWSKLMSQRCLEVIDSVPDECDTHHRILSVNKQRKHVSFNLEANQVQLIATIAIDLWWSPEEMHASRRDDKLDAVVKESAHEYCRVYERARRQVHMARKLDAANLEHLVTGLAFGYRGLEQYSAVTATQRKLAVHDHVMSVVQCHRDSKSGALSNSLDDSSKHSSCSSGSSTVRTPDSTRRVNLERTVRNQSTKLSAGNRHFATALGRAEHLAAAWDDDKTLTSAAMT
jgi:hypothetical protein